MSENLKAGDSPGDNPVDRHGNGHMAWRFHAQGTCCTVTLIQHYKNSGCITLG